MSAADPIAILGSGMAGCGAAHRLHQSGVRSVMYDKNAYYGGHTSSHQFPGGWTFDEGPHVSFTKERRLQDLFAENVGGEFQRLATYVNNYWRGHWIKHPAQCNLYGLPTDLVVRVLRDFIAAQGRKDAVVENYEDWLRASYGDTFAETFPMEYTVKYHTTTASNLNTGWIGPRLYQANLEEVLRGALEPSTADVHYISDFRYPTRGGFASYLEPFMRQTELRLQHEVVHIDPRARTLRFANGATAGYAELISSVPLPELVPMIEGAPAEVRRAAELLACTEVVIVCLGIDRPDLVDAHWTYFYDRDVFFTRLSTPHLQSPAHGSAGLRQPAGRVLLLAQVPAPRPGTRRLHRAGDPGSLPLQRAARDGQDPVPARDAHPVRERDLRSRLRRGARHRARVSRRGRHRVVRPLWRLGLHLDRPVLHERRERGSEGARRAGPTRAMSAAAGYGTM